MKITNHSQPNTAHPLHYRGLNKAPQRGLLQAFLIILVILGISVWGVSTLLQRTITLESEREKVTNQQLEAAKKALVDYAIIPPPRIDLVGNPGRYNAYFIPLFQGFHDTHFHPFRFFSLPCPDTVNDFNLDGASDIVSFSLASTPGLDNCLDESNHTNNLEVNSRFGRLPWRNEQRNRLVSSGASLFEFARGVGGKDYRDGYGGRLWYVVSDNVTPKNTPLNPHALLRITTGWLTVRNEAGETLSDRVAAIVIAAGAPAPVAASLRLHTNNFGERFTEDHFYDGSTAGGFNRPDVISLHVNYLEPPTYSALGSGIVTLVNKAGDIAADQIHYLTAEELAAGDGQGIARLEETGEFIDKFLEGDAEFPAITARLANHLRTFGHLPSPASFHESNVTTFTRPAGTFVGVSVTVEVTESLLRDDENNIVTDAGGNSIIETVTTTITSPLTAIPPTFIGSSPEVNVVTEVTVVITPAVVRVSVGPPRRDSAGRPISALRTTTTLTPPITTTMTIRTTTTTSSPTAPVTAVIFARDLPPVHFLSTISLAIGIPPPEPGDVSFSDSSEIIFPYNTALFDLDTRFNSEPLSDDYRMTLGDHYPDGSAIGISESRTNVCCPFRGRFLDLDTTTEEIANSNEPPANVKIEVIEDVTPEREEVTTMTMTMDVFQDVIVPPEGGNYRLENVDEIVVAPRGMNQAIPGGVTLRQKVGEETTTTTMTMTFEAVTTTITTRTNTGGGFSSDRRPAPLMMSASGIVTVILSEPVDAYLEVGNISAVLALAGGLDDDPDYLDGLPPYAKKTRLPAGTPITLNAENFNMQIPPNANLITSTNDGVPIIHPDISTPIRIIPKPDNFNEIITVAGVPNGPPAYQNDFGWLPLAESDGPITETFTESVTETFSETSVVEEEYTEEVLTGRLDTTKPQITVGFRTELDDEFNLVDVPVLEFPPETEIVTRTRDVIKTEDVDRTRNVIRTRVVPPVLPAIYPAGTQIFIGNDDTSITRIKSEISFAQHFRSSGLTLIPFPAPLVPAHASASEPPSPVIIRSSNPISMPVDTRILYAPGGQFTIGENFVIPENSVIKFPRNTVLTVRLSPNTVLPDGRALNNPDIIPGFRYTLTHGGVAVVGANGLFPLDVDLERGPDIMRESVSREGINPPRIVTSTITTPSIIAGEKEAAFDIELRRNRGFFNTGWSQILPPPASGIRFPLLSRAGDIINPFTGKNTAVTAPVTIKLRTDDQLISSQPLRAKFYTRPKHFITHLPFGPIDANAPCRLGCLASVFVTPQAITVIHKLSAPDTLETLPVTPPVTDPVTPMEEITLSVIFDERASFVLPANTTLDITLAFNLTAIDPMIYTNPDGDLISGINKAGMELFTFPVSTEIFHPNPTLFSELSIGIGEHLLLAEALTVNLIENWIRDNRPVNIDGVLAALTSNLMLMPDSDMQLLRGGDTINIAAGSLIDMAEGVVHLPNAVRRVPRVRENAGLISTDNMIVYFPSAVTLTSYVGPAARVPSPGATFGGVFTRQDNSGVGALFLTPSQYEFFPDNAARGYTDIIAVTTADDPTPRPSMTVTTFHTEVLESTDRDLVIPQGAFMIYPPGATLEIFNRAQTDEGSNVHINHVDNSTVTHAEPSVDDLLVPNEAVLVLPPGTAITITSRSDFYGRGPGSLFETGAPGAVPTTIAGPAYIAFASHQNPLGTSTQRRYAFIKNTASIGDNTPYIDINTPPIVFLEEDALIIDMTRGSARDNFYAQIPKESLVDFYGYTESRANISTPSTGLGDMQADADTFFKDFPMLYAVAPECRESNLDGVNCAEGIGEGLRFEMQEGEEYTLEESLLSPDSILLTSSLSTISLRIRTATATAHADAVLVDGTGAVRIVGGALGLQAHDQIIVEPADTIVTETETETETVTPMVTEREITNFDHNPATGRFDLLVTLTIRTTAQITTTMTVTTATTMDIDVDATLIGYLGATDFDAAALTTLTRVELPTAFTTYVGGYIGTDYAEASGRITVASSITIDIGPGTKVRTSRNEGVFGPGSTATVEINGEATAVDLANYLLVNLTNYSLSAEVNAGYRYTDSHALAAGAFAAVTNFPITVEFRNSGEVGTPDTTPMTGPPPTGVVNRAAVRVADGAGIAMEEGYLWQGYVPAPTELDFHRGSTSTAAINPDNYLSYNLPGRDHNIYSLIPQRDRDQLQTPDPDFVRARWPGDGLYLRVPPTVTAFNFYGSGQERPESMDGIDNDERFGYKPLTDALEFRASPFPLPTTISAGFSVLRNTLGFLAEPARGDEPITIRIRVRDNNGVATVAAIWHPEVRLPNRFLGKSFAEGGVQGSRQDYFNLTQDQRTTRGLRWNYHNHPFRDDYEAQNYARRLPDHMWTNGAEDDTYIDGFMCNGKSVVGRGDNFPVNSGIFSNAERNILPDVPFNMPSYPINTFEGNAGANRNQLFGAWPVITAKIFNFPLYPDTGGRELDSEDGGVILIEQQAILTDRTADENQGLFLNTARDDRVLNLVSQTRTPYAPLTVVSHPSPSLQYTHDPVVAASVAPITVQSDWFFYMDRAFNTRELLGIDPARHRYVKRVTLRFGDAFRISGPGAIMPPLGAQNEAALADVYAERSLLFNHLFNTPPLSPVFDDRVRCGGWPGRHGGDLPCFAMAFEEHWQPIVHGVAAFDMGAYATVSILNPSAEAGDLSQSPRIIMPQPTAEVEIVTSTVAGAENSTVVIHAGSIIYPLEGIILPSTPIPEGNWRLALNAPAIAGVDVSPAIAPRAQVINNDVEATFRTNGNHFTEAAHDREKFRMAPILSRMGDCIIEPIGFPEPRIFDLSAGRTFERPDPPRDPAGPPQNGDFLHVPESGAIDNVQGSGARQGGDFHDNILGYDASFTRGFLANDAMQQFLLNYYNGRPAFTSEAFGTPTGEVTTIVDITHPAVRVRELPQRIVNGQLASVTIRYTRITSTVDVLTDTYGYTPRARSIAGLEKETGPPYFPSNRGINRRVQNNTDVEIGHPLSYHWVQAGSHYMQLGAERRRQGDRGIADRQRSVGVELVTRGDEFQALRLPHRINIPMNQPLFIKGFSGDIPYPNTKENYFEFPQGSIARILNADAGSWVSAVPYVARYLKGLRVTLNPGGTFGNSAGSFSGIIAVEGPTNDGLREIDVSGRKVLHYQRSERNEALGPYSSAPVYTNVWIRLPEGGVLTNTDDEDDVIALPANTLLNPIMGTYIIESAGAADEVDVERTEGIEIETTNLATAITNEELIFVRPAYSLPVGTRVRIGSAGGTLTNVKAAVFFSLTPIDNALCPHGQFELENGQHYDDPTDADDRLDTARINQITEGQSAAQTAYEIAAGHSIGAAHPCLWLDDPENTDGDHNYIYRSRRRYADDKLKINLQSNDRTFVYGGRLRLNKKVATDV